MKDSLPSITSYQIKPNASFTARTIFRFHELNELYDGTVNQLHHFAFSTMDISSNEVLTYQKAMKEAAAELFIAAIQKEISDHELHDHWSIVKQSTIPSTAKTIQAFWSFKR